MSDVGEMASHERMELMEVVARGVELSGKRKRFYRGGVEGVGIAFAYLHATMAEQKRFSGDDEPELMKGVAGDEEIGDASFVF